MADHVHPHPQGQSHEWHNGLMTCTPIGDCCLGTWCPCILYGRTLHRERDPTLANYEKTNDDCKRMGHLQCWTSCGFIYVKRHRTELREKYGIPGTTKNDCWATFCCLPCAQIQMDKEVALREAHRINKDGYRPQDGMTMPNQEPMAPVGQQPMTAAPQPGVNGV
ncbi:PLAC8-domain-containing protein [Sarocladium strictum]